MDDQHPDRHDDPPGEDLADELLRRALLDPQDAAAVALKVAASRSAEELTVVFHGRRDLGTIQTYVANGGHGEGEKLGARDLLRVPVDLDLGRGLQPRGGPGRLRAPRRARCATRCRPPTPSWRSGTARCATSPSRA